MSCKLKKLVSKFRYAISEVVYAYFQQGTDFVCNKRDYAISEVCNK